MVKILLILNLFYCSALFAQHPFYNNCDCHDEICYVPSWAYKDTLIKARKQDFLRGYINFYNSKDSYYVNSDSSNLKEFYTFYRNDTSLIFINGLKYQKQYAKVKIKAVYERRTLMSTICECLPEDSTICFDAPFDADSTVNYGLDELGESTYKFIKEINLVTEKGTINVPSKLFRDFTNPNFMSQYYGIAPVKVYYDKVKDYYAIYIYGSYDDSYYFMSGRGSYLCKIYIDLKHKKVGRIIMEGDYLTVYGLFDCLNFWMF